MKELLVDDDLARRFLLGEVSPQEEGEVAEMAFADPDTFALLESAEDDLIDDFIQDELSPNEKERFENHFLLQRRRAENLKLSRALQHYLDQEEEDAPPVLDDGRVSILGWFSISRPTLRLSLGVAALLIGVVFILFLWTRTREPQPLPFEARSVPSVTPTPQINNTPPEKPSPQAPPDNRNSSPSPRRQPGTSAYAVLLPLSITRGEAQTLTVPSNAAVVPVELPLIGRTAYSNYQAVLQRDEGPVLQSWSNLHAQHLQAGRGLQVNIPTALLKPEELYFISVSGRAADGTFKEVNRYPFKAVNSQ